MDNLLNPLDRQAILDEVLTKDKVTLVCKTHQWAYGSKKPPVFRCKDCMMVSFVGLLCNTPPNKREEVMEMIEYSVHKLIEADNRGEIDRIKLFKHPKVTVEHNVN